MGFGNSATLPLIALPPESVIFPGTTASIPIAGRSDITSILQSYIQNSNRSNAPPTINLACVPLRSQDLGFDGQQLLKDTIEEHEGEQRRSTIEPAEASDDDLFRFGTVARVLDTRGRSSPELWLQVRGLQRFRVDQVLPRRQHLWAKITLHHDDKPDEDDQVFRSDFDLLKQESFELIALWRLTFLLDRSSSSLSPLMARRLELFIMKKDFSQAGALADFGANMVECDFAEKLRVLASLDAKARVHSVLELVQRHVASVKQRFNITTVASDTSPSNFGVDISALNPKQRQALLKRAMMGLAGSNTPRTMGNDPGEDGDNNETDELKRRVKKAELSPEALKVAERELKRLERLSPANAEYSVCRTYLENLIEIPWSATTNGVLDAHTLSRARKQLDDDHYGLEKIKKRLLEYLAILRLKQDANLGIDSQISEVSETLRKLRQDDTHEQNEAESDSRVREVEEKLHTLRGRRATDKSPILLLQGPPGVGKTSLARSVAAALNRKFHRISLGGVRDEAEIRGHRRTYVAAMPGMIVNGLKKTRVANPVFLLDEIDKVGGSNFHGDPSAALLEVLDPEQNCSFTDHYVNIPLDLSKVLFIATANTLDTIPPPLVDRMETITLAGYTTVEKRHIAQRHLIPKQIKTNGLAAGQVELSDDAIDAIATQYTRESGVRNLEREIGAVCRYKAVQYSDANDSGRLEGFNASVSADELEDILGVERFEEEIAENEARPGVVTGLVAYSSGGQGSILFIEVADMPGNGGIKLTGKLGEVLKESVEVALSWVKAHSYSLGLTHSPHEDVMKDRSVHVHCPSGAIPKDGPSAGLAHTIALISLFSGKAVPPRIAMTGEISLRGKVMPVGGIKEKLIGAHRAGVKAVLLPDHNRKDLKDVPEEVKRDLNVICVR